MENARNRHSLLYKGMDEQKANSHNVKTTEDRVKGKLKRKASPFSYTIQCDVKFDLLLISQGLGPISGQRQ